MRSRTRLIFVALLIGLSTSSPSAAEPTLLRWTHPDASNVSGFRVSIGYAPGDYVPELEAEFVGVTAQNGIFQGVVEIDASQAVYVAVRAYNDESTSIHSNERVFASTLGAPGRPQLTEE